VGDRCDPPPTLKCLQKCTLYLLYSYCINFYWAAITLCVLYYYLKHTFRCQTPYLELLITSLGRDAAMMYDYTDTCMVERISFVWTLKWCFKLFHYTVIIDRNTAHLSFIFLILYISSDLISSEPSAIECAVKWPSLLWLQPVKQDSVTYFVLIGRSHGELGRFTAHSVPLSSDEMRSVATDVHIIIIIVIIIGMFKSGLNS